MTEMSAKKLQGHEMTPGGRLIANHVKSRMQPVFTLTKDLSVGTGFGEPETVRVI